MKTVIGAVLEEWREIVVGALVKIVAKLMMHDGEILCRGLDAGLDANIVLEINVLGARVANHFAVSRLYKQ
jgi:hypothetical protein